MGRRKELAKSGKDAQEAQLSKKVAATVLRPSIRAATTVNCFRPAALSPLELGSMVDALSEQAEKVKAGDLGRMEEMLATQAHTLDAIFNRLASRAAMFIGEQPEMVDMYLKLALRAQSQCRTSIEALAEVKNPPVVFARQANFSGGGPQQVNNGVGVARAHGTEIPQNELLEVGHGQRMDPGAPGQASGADPGLAPLGTVNGTQNRRREGPSKSQRVEGRD